MNAIPMHDRLAKLLKDNDIRGCVVLITEDGDTVTTTHAVNNIHNINIVLGMGIVAKTFSPDDGSAFGRILRGAAQTMIDTHHIVTDLARGGGGTRGDERP